jgi:hypothetical protein
VIRHGKSICALLDLALDVREDGSHDHVIDLPRQTSTVGPNRFYCQDKININCITFK